jgi:outer membrane lipoprotein SlyB
MRSIKRKVVVASLIALGLAACASTPEEKKLTGQIVGGVTGAAVGSLFGQGTGRVVAAGAGAVLGTIVGGKVAEKQ